MFRSASRTTSLLRTRAPVVAARGTGPGGRRFVNTGNSSTGSGSSSGSGSEGKDKPRSWRNTTLRLGLAIGAVYYYNTSDVFSQLPSCTLSFSLHSFHYGIIVYPTNQKQMIQSPSAPNPKQPKTTTTTKPPPPSPVSITKSPLDPPRIPQNRYHPSPNPLTTPTPTPMPTRKPRSTPTRARLTGTVRV